MVPIGLLRVRGGVRASHRDWSSIERWEAIVGLLRVSIRNHIR